MEDVWVPVVAYADDILILAHSEQQLQEMLTDVVEAFEKVGLSINLGKTHFSSTVENKDATLTIGPVVVKWTKDFELLGSMITLAGNDASAIKHRMMKATKTYNEWKPILENKRLPSEARMNAYKVSVLSSLAWCSQTWTPTEKQFDKMRSWNSRHGSCMKFMKRYHTEDLGQWWRRLHKEGKRYMAQGKVDVVSFVKGTKFNFAGHLARLDSQDVMKQVLMARSLAGWRHKQKLQSARPHVRVAGGSSHPKRFNALRRWETAFENFFGMREMQNPGDLVGWMSVAQNRDEWKKKRASFVSYK